VNGRLVASRSAIPLRSKSAIELALVDWGFGAGRSLRRSCIMRARFGCSNVASTAVASGRTSEPRPDDPTGAAS